MASRSIRRVLRACLAAWLLAVLLPVAAHAHPHVFVDNTMDVVFDAQGMSGIRVTWKFDPMASMQYLADLDPNGDGVLTREEWEAQREDIAGFLAEERFFLYIMVNGTTVPVTAVHDFVVTYADGVLTYTFFAPLAVPRGSRVLVAVYDPSYYTDFQTYESGVRLSGEPDGAEFAFEDAPELAFYGGQVIPMAARIVF
ncbi:hypothetical protein DSM19430T_10980 [Desulfovibrio psychrotolerans]|uniref:ABC transporter substrate-binding protein n=1 Tax=Desulfovibrio psychrotolerans TaxID=415242 RepID=A0A7J0BTV1_9BACT|nr:hypothetical protein DSM19430T_10980 [Desulfovibrio psychrotolerans]